MDNRYEVIVIGAGPAGMTAAIYAKRAGLNAAMIEFDAPGGKMVKTFEIENYPSYSEVNGADLSMKMFEHTQSLEIPYLYGNVIKIEDGKIKKVICADGSVYEGKSVIVATGTKEKLLNVPGEKEFTSKGVSYCAVCDATFFKDKDVAIVGGGNSALEEALYLSDKVNKIYIIIRRDVFRAEESIQDKILNNPKIEIIKKHVPVEILGDSKVNGFVIENVDTKERTTLNVEGIFPYIGSYPNTAFLDGLGISDEAGYILTNDRMETKVAGIFGAGDCNKKELRQVVTATSDGAIAGQNAYHYVRENFE